MVDTGKLPRHGVPRGKCLLTPWRNKRGQYIPIGLKLSNEDRLKRGTDLYELWKQRNWIKREIPWTKREIEKTKRYLKQYLEWKWIDRMKELEKELKYLELRLIYLQENLPFVRKKIKETLYKPDIPLFRDYYFNDWYKEEYFSKHYYLGITRAGRVIFIFNPNEDCFDAAERTAEYIHEELMKSIPHIAKKLKPYPGKYKGCEYYAFEE